MNVCLVLLHVACTVTVCLVCGLKCFFIFFIGPDKEILFA